jgi:hypothetical protein
LSEIHLDPLPHYRLAVKDLSNSDGGVLIEEGDYYAAEGLEGCPGVDRCRSVDEVFDGLEVVCTEDFGILEVGDK